MNTEYLLWFAALVAVAGLALMWLAIGQVPEIPPELVADDQVAISAEVAEAPGLPSERAGEDWIAGTG